MHEYIYVNILRNCKNLNATSKGFQTNCECIAVMMKLVHIGNLIKVYWSLEAKLVLTYYILY